MGRRVISLSWTSSDDHFLFLMTPMPNSPIPSTPLRGGDLPIPIPWTFLGLPWLGFLGFLAIPDPILLGWLLPIPPLFAPSLYWAFCPYLASPLLISLGFLALTFIQRLRRLGVPDCRSVLIFQSGVISFKTFFRIQRSSASSPASLGSSSNDCPWRLRQCQRTPPALSRIGAATRAECDGRGEAAAGERRGRSRRRRRRRSGRTEEPCRRR